MCFSHFFYDALFHFFFYKKKKDNFGLRLLFKCMDRNCAQQLENANWHNTHEKKMYKYSRSNL